MAVFFSVVSKMVSNIAIFQGIVSKLEIPVSLQHYCEVHKYYEFEMCINSNYILI